MHPKTLFLCILGRNMTFEKNRKFLIFCKNFENFEGGRRGDRCHRRPVGGGEGWAEAIGDVMNVIHDVLRCLDSVGGGFGRF